MGSNPVTSTKKDYFTRLNERHITKNKYFWETVKFFWSSKFQPSERIKLSEEDDTLIPNEEEVAMETNDFVSTSVINLKILKSQNFDLLSENIELLLWKLLVSIENIRALLQ